MAFKASKKRERKAPDAVAEGTQLIPSASVRLAYQKKIDAICKAMLDDYKATIDDALKTKTMRKFYAQDASAASKMQEVMKALDKKWTSIFKAYAKEAADYFTKKVDDHSKATVHWSLSTAGIKAPTFTYSENITNTLGAAQDFNSTLITNISADAHEKIYNAVMLSLTSPNPEEQGQRGIHKALSEAGEFSKKRAQLIARDQNSKLYASLNVDRMRENGVEKFRWKHSSAGKVPRKSHLDKNGEIFELDDPRLWQGAKADQGPPGWAINCRCVASPII